MKRCLCAAIFAALLLIACEQVQDHEATIQAAADTAQDVGHAVGTAWPPAELIGMTAATILTSLVAVNRAMLARRLAKRNGSSNEQSNEKRGS